MPAGSPRHRTVTVDPAHEPHQHGETQSGGALGALSHFSSMRLRSSGHVGPPPVPARRPTTPQAAPASPAMRRTSSAASIATTSVAMPMEERQYKLDVEALAEAIERRDMNALELKFGGVDGFVHVVESSADAGVAGDTVEQRRKEFGANKLRDRPPVRYWEFLVDALKDRVIEILIVCSIIAILFGVLLPNPHTGKVERGTGWIEGTAILISAWVVVLIGSIQNYKKAKKFEELEREQSIKKVSVIRDGHETTIDSTELVVGDVLILETGMEVMCDALLIRGEDLRTNEAPITGEPDLIEKGPDNDVFLISGTSVEEGTGVVMVCAVGMSSFQGRMKASMDEEASDTPLQEKLTHLGDRIGTLGLVLAILLVLALSIKEVIYITEKGRDANASRFLSFVVIAVTLIAVAIPEGLPLAVTISLAFSMKAMMKQNCLVRVLASCETMGAATAVCSDKTGTMTKNEMTVVQAMLAEDEFMLDKYGVKPRNDGVAVIGRDELREKIKTDAELLKKYVCVPLSLNSTAREQKNDAGDIIWVGNKTEVGLLGLVQRLGHDYAATRKEIQPRMKQYPFSSLKKHMTTLVKADDGFDVYVKGASEAILDDCETYLTKSGETAELTDAKKEEFNEIIVDMARQGNRTIGIACGTTTGREFPDDEPDDCRLTFVGVVGIQDPIRPEVPDAVDSCHTAGLIVRMVTGDNIETAKAIATKARVYNEAEGHIAMTGPDFRAKFREDKAGLIAQLPNLRVLARSSPNDKYVLVGLLHDELGDVVGVTGDGTNDAPALKLADVGLAMNSGTDIAKGAADMVLLDDNFATVVTAIKWGRGVNDNIRKFLQYQLAINLAGVGLTIISSLASNTSKEALAPVQLLWLNLIMDTLAALALATELPEDASLHRDPVYKQAPIISNRMRVFILAHGAYQLTLVLLFLFLGHEWFDTRESETSCKDSGGVYHSDGICQQGKVHSTLLFNMFIWFQIFNAFNARKIHGELNVFEGLWARSKIMLLVFGLVVALQIIAVEVGGAALKVTRLSWKFWLISIVFGASELVVGLLLRLLPVKDYVPTREELIEARRKAATEEEKKHAEEEEEKAIAQAERSMRRLKKEKKKEAKKKKPAAQEFSPPAGDGSDFNPSG